MSKRMIYKDFVQARIGEIQRSARGIEGGELLVKALDLLANSIEAETTVKEFVLSPDFKEE